MQALIVVGRPAACLTDAQGHALGAKMESDMREELFGHYTPCPSLLRQQSTGQTDDPITNDLLALAELYHHGPEDLRSRF
jgi:ATP-binding cassette subfamily B protein